MTVAQDSMVRNTSADMPLPGHFDAPVAISHVAVLYEPMPGAMAHPWEAARVRDQVAGLMTDGGLQFDYFPVSFSGIEAGAGIAAAFTQIAAAPEGLMPDLVLVIGGPAVTADIAVIHRVLAPCILAAPMPVFTALGPDDAETILGDTACRVFPGVHAMLDAIAKITRAGRAPVEQLRQEIQSLGRFLLSQQEAESRIMMQALLVPALRRRFDQQTEHSRQTDGQVQPAIQKIRLRLVREEAMLEQVRARIGIELARLALQPAAVALDGPGHLRLRRLRIGMLFGLLCLIAILWWSTSAASTVFFSGCALVVGSAIYVALSNRIIDANAVPANSLGRREPSAADIPIEKKEPFHE